MVTSLPADLDLAPLEGESRPLAAWLTTFHLCSVVVDPYTNQSSWVLDAASRILTHFQGAGVRANWIVTAPVDDARAFLGPLADRFLTFVDPDRTFVKAAGLSTLPAFLLVQQNLTVAAAAEGWDPAAWKVVGDAVADLVSWTRPTIPGSGDPLPFAGSPAR